MIPLSFHHRTQLSVKDRMYFIQKAMHAAVCPNQQAMMVLEHEDYGCRKMV